MVSIINFKSLCLIFPIFMLKTTYILATILYDDEKKVCVDKLLTLGQSKFCADGRLQSSCADFFTYICEYKQSESICSKVARLLFVNDLCASKKGGPASCPSEFEQKCPPARLPTRNACYKKLLANKRDVFCVTYSWHEECWEVFNEFCALTDDEKMEKPANKPKSKGKSSSASSKSSKTQSTSESTNQQSEDTETKSTKSAEPAGPKDENMIECCKAQGVAEKCMPLCSYNPDFDIICNNDCLTEIKKTTYCASNGQNNVDCCKKNPILGNPDNSVCLAFCEGEVPPLDAMFKDFTNMLKYQPCTSAMAPIMTCHKDNSPETAEWDKRSWKQESISPEIKAVLEGFGDCKSKAKQEEAKKEDPEPEKESDKKESDSKSKSSKATKSESKKGGSENKKSNSSKNGGGKESPKKSSNGKSETEAKSNGEKQESKTLSGKEASKKKDEQVMECCKAQGVPKQCLGMCSYAPKFDLCKMECYNELKKSVYCASNTLDNTDCCKTKPVFADPNNAHCLQMCAGKVPPLSEMFGDLGSMLKYRTCSSESKWMMTCHKKNSPTQNLWEKRDWEEESLSKDSMEVLKSFGKC